MLKYYILLNTKFLICYYGYALSHKLPLALLVKIPVENDKN